jgi:4-amino-4-deoxy-L-arabinose transferase-like glycosyltransferase
MGKGVSSLTRRTGWFLLALAALYLLFIHRLGDRDLWSSHEARAGMNARSVLAGTGWPVPHLADGRPDLQKPPLYYWLVAGLARARAALTGKPPVIDAWAVRLPSALAALGCVALLVFAFPGRRGVLAGLILATALHFTWLGRIGRIDMPLAFTTTLAVLAFSRGSWSVGRGAWSEHAKPQAAKRATLLFLGYLAVAAGVLLKGPVGAVLPAAAVAAHLLVEGEWPAFWEVGAWASLTRRLGLGWGLPLVLLLALPWFVWADGYTGGQLFHEFFWLHNVERGLGSARLPGHPWWLYVPYFLGDFLPWSPLFLLALFLARKQGWWRREPLGRLGLAWFLGVFLVLSCSSFKRADYLLPAYPGAALFLACMVHRAWRFSRLRLGIFRAIRLLHRLVIPLIVLTVLGWVVRLEWVLPAAEPYRDYRAFAAEVRRRAPRPEEVVFFRTEAHALAFRLGGPLAVEVEWGRLWARLYAPGVHHVIMPAEVWGHFPPPPAGLRLVECCRNTRLAGGRHERPLVLVQAVRDNKKG